ncbi:MAG TPA: glycosyltransferase family 87 protein [Chloroflexota bacterium]|nr:glycosyltransferase family 87 protein [Chloroflexota bacterium]
MAEIEQAARRQRRPFRPIPAAHRLAFFVTIFAALYLAFDVYMYVTRGLFLYVGVDYRSFWASAQIARSAGFAAVYDLDLQRQLQEPLVHAFASPLHELQWATIPTPYLPGFVALLGPLLLLPPDLGFVVWTAVNVVMTLGYLVWFWRGVGGSATRSLLLALCLSFPMLETFQFGQVNGWLTIFLGEFFRLAIARAELRSGLWLSCMLLKPQTLMLIAPGLLVARRWRAALGATAGGAGIVGISLAFGGIDALLADARLIFLYSGHVPSTVPRDMMNWRSLAIHLSDALPAQLAWTLAMAGLVATLVAGLALWLNARDASPEQFALVVLGSFAATSAVAWHAHTHMGLPMTIPLLYLAARGRISIATLAVWLIAPYVMFATLRLVFDLGNVGVLFVNLYLLGWSIAQLRSRASEESATTVASIAQASP